MSSEREKAVAEKTRANMETTIALSIVVPVYNEAARIPAAMDTILAHLDELHENYELIVVDDGSTDETSSLVERIAQKTSRVRLLRHAPNHGKGYAVRKGMLNAVGEFVLFTDVDLSAPISEAYRLLEPLKQDYDLVIGSRGLRPEWISVHQSGFRESAGKMFNVFMRGFMGLRFRDTQCGFKAFRLDAARKIFAAQTLHGFGFDVEVLYLARKFGFRALEVPVHWAHNEQTKVRPLRDGSRMLWDLLQIRSNDWRGRYGS